MRRPLNEEGSEVTQTTAALLKQPVLEGRKLEAVTSTAQKLFLDQGFSATSMEAIAKAAGVSKATLYAYFPSKESLFACLITALCEGLERYLPSPKLSDGLYPALQEFSRQYLRIFIERKELAFVHIIANESIRFPELGRLFYESGPLATTRRLAQFLDEAKAKGLLEFDDSMMAATQFLSLIRGESPLRTLLGMSDFNQETIDREIESGLRLFLKACQPAGLGRE